MIQKTLLISCFSVLLLFSCSQGSGKNVGISGEEAEEREGARAAKVAKTLDGDGDGDGQGDGEDEAFELFIQHFSNDKTFQLKRITFPISVIIPDTEHEGMASTEESIGKYDWEPLDLTYDSTYLTRPFDQYSQVVRYKNDTAVVEIRGVNNGIYADYYFTLIDKKWFLVTLYEASF